MRYLCAGHTDIGIQKRSNQDSFLIQEASIPSGSTLLAVLCDGLGGLQKGELASATMIRAFADWFQYQYPILLRQRFTAGKLKQDWVCLVTEIHQRLLNYGERHHLTAGTTVEAMLFLNGRYYIFHIGDCRIYKKESVLMQLTKDQTYIQQEIDRGRMTPEQAGKNPMRNTLLQCVGASPHLTPDFLQGKAVPGQGFLICSDGFRHKVRAAEMAEKMRLPSLKREDYMKKRLKDLTRLCKLRGETDNITSIWIEVCE